MKTLVTTLALAAGLMGAAAVSMPAHADEGVIVTRHTTVVEQRPGYAGHQYRTVKQKRCWWHNHRRVCKVRWVRAYR